MAKKGNGAGKSAFSKYENLIIDPKKYADKFGYLSTGSPRVDNLLGGGLTMGRSSELYGREQSGKSTMALSVARNVIAKGGRVLWLDLERGLELRPEGQGSWLEINGINPFNGTFDIIQAGKEAIPGEDIYNIMIASVRENKHQYIVLDSMAALVTRQELDGEIGDSTFGSVAKLNSQALKVLSQLQGTNFETHITFINQVRDQLQGGMGGLKSTGGRALPHYVHQKLRFDKVGRAVKQKDGDFLTPIRVRIEKARGAPASECEITISAKRGIDVLTELFEAAVDSGYVQKAGAWYALYNRPIETSEYKDASKPQDIEGFLLRCQGETGIRQAIESNEELKAELFALASQITGVDADEEDSE